MRNMPQDPVQHMRTLTNTCVAQCRSEGLAAELVQGRGWDHGVYIPLLLMLPQADVPVVQARVTLLLLQLVDMTCVIIDVCIGPNPSMVLPNATLGSLPCQPRTSRRL